MDGFDYYNNPAQKYPGVSGPFMQTPGRNGVQNCSLNDNQILAAQLLPAQEHATMIIGLALYKQDPSPYFDFWFQSDAGATTHAHVRILSDGSVTVYRGDAGTLLGSAPAGTIPEAQITNGSWCYIEVKAVLHDTTGSIEVRRNGSATPIINLTGIDTKNGGTKTVFDRWALHAKNGVWRIDDFYVCNGAGSANNNFLGDVAVRTLFPTADGTNRNMTGVGTVAGTGTGTWQNVDETGAGNTTDYNYSATNDVYDTYGVTDLPSTTGQIAGVQVQVLAAKSDLGAKSVAPMIRSGGTDYTGTDVPLGQSYTYARQLYEQNPNTSAAWTPSGVNAAEFGAKVRP